jgi:hypothetical protein
MVEEFQFDFQQGLIFLCSVQFAADLSGPPSFLFSIHHLLGKVGGGDEADNIPLPTLWLRLHIVIPPTLKVK